MTNQEFIELKKHIEEILHVNDTNALKLCRQVPLLYQQYLDLYLTELQSLKELKAERDVLYGQLWHKFRRESRYDLDSKHEVESYIKSDKIYYELAIKINKQEIYSTYLEQTVNNIKQLGYSIRNYLDFKKYLNGY